MSDFKEFQKWFKFYQKKFGLTGYQVYFKYEPLEGRFASIEVSQTSMVAVVRLNSKLDKDEIPFKNIKADAKHEAIHLLTNKIQSLACCRYVQPEEITEATEELVIRLEGLIGD
jgi:predicted metal-binding protein